MSRTRPVILLFLFLLAAPFVLRAQKTPLNWVPQGMEALGQNAAFHTDFTFDRSMLQLASNFMGGADEQAKLAMAKLNGISVHSYHFSAPGLYDPAALDAVRREYRTAGWEHLVTAHANGDPFNAGQTDLWVSFSHMDVTGIVVLVSDPKNLDLIAFSGDISPLDVLHLRGHFGIPRFPGDRFVSPSGRQAIARTNSTPPGAPALPSTKPSPYSPRPGEDMQAAPPPPQP